MNLPVSSKYLTRVYMQDYYGLLTQIIPTLTWYNWLKIHIKPLFIFRVNIINQMINIFYELDHNSQVNSIQKRLNDKYDYNDRAIYLENATFHEPVYFYEPEDDKPIYFYDEIDNGPIYFHDQEILQSAAEDFTVFVPLSLWDESDKQANEVSMSIIIDDLKLYSKNYVIKYY